MSREHEATAGQPEKKGFWKRAKKLLTERQVPDIGPVMTEGLSYAMQYRGGRLENEEIKTLVSKNLTDLATYALLKGLDNRANTQQQFLESFIDISLTYPEDRTLFKTLQEQALEENTGENSLSLEGKKAALIFLQGPDVWEDRFTEIAEDVRDNTPNVTPVYIGYSGTLGLRQGIQAFKGSERKMFMLIPSWIEDADNTHCGYEIDLEEERGKRAKLLAKDFNRAENPILIDDTKKTGKKLQEMWDFWTENTGGQIPKASFRVVDTSA